MKENRNLKYYSTILYVVAFAVFSWFLYCSIVKTSPFARAGLLIVVCVFMYLGTRALAKNTDRKKAQKQMKITFSLMFVFYVLLLVGLLFFDGYFGRDMVHFEGEWNRENILLYLKSSVNIVPFKTAGSLICDYCKGWIPLSTPLINIGGNIVAFMPFALFLPMFFKKLRKAVPFLLSVAGIVVIVELTQLCFQCGICDIDDLILNVSGAGFLFLILHIKPVRKCLDKLTFGLY